MSKVLLNSEHFPDGIFRDWLLDHVFKDNKEGDVIETDNVEMLSIALLAADSVRGIELFTKVRRIIIESCSIKDGTFDFSSMTELENLRFSNNKRNNKINISGCVNLKSFFINDCNVRKIDVRKNTKLKLLTVFNDRTLRRLDLSHNHELEELNISTNPNLETLVFGSAPNMNRLYLTFAWLSGKAAGINSADFSNFPNLRSLELHSNMNMKELDLTVCPEIVDVCVTNCPLQHIDFPVDSKITKLVISDCELSDIDFSRTKMLKGLNISNGIKKGSVDFSDLKELNELIFERNESSFINLSGCEKLESIWMPGIKAKELDLSGLKMLKEIRIDNGELTIVRLDGCSSLEHIYLPRNNISSLDARNCGKLSSIQIRENPLRELQLPDGFDFC